MARPVASLWLWAIAACSRSEGIADEQLGGLVVEAKPLERPIDAARAAKDRGELTRALERPHRAMIAALGPHSITIASSTQMIEAGAQISELSDRATIEIGAAGAFHAVYNNSADYGREAIFVDGTLYLRPRYQRWHQRAPESSDEPAAIRDSFFEPVAAAWELLGEGGELTDQGSAQVAGRAGKRIAIKLAPTPHRLAPEPLPHRKWRETRTIEELSGEVILDADRGVPLWVKLAGTVGFTRDGRRFKMKTTIESGVSTLGPAAISAPAQTEVVATPERHREVDDRDYLLQGIAPPILKNPDGTALTPQPQRRAGAREGAGK
jgi:hypothetical protein